MELPAPLRAALDRALDGHSIGALASAGSTLSRRYRAETRDGRLHLADEAAALAYLATRMPATFSAVRRALIETAGRAPGFSPRTLLDVGAGPGTVLWAASDVWQTLDHARLVEASPAIRACGEGSAQGGDLPERVWIDGRAEEALGDAQPADLVTLAYVLDELDEAARGRLVARLWALTRDMLVLVEPGTPAGWGRILAAREALLADGAHMIAPCAHALSCPIEAPDWCHFAERLARSRAHRLAKGAEAPYEDEKFIFLAVSRRPHDGPAERILARPQAGSGKVRLKVCAPDGSAHTLLVTRRDGERFKAARRADWGDSLD